MAKAATANNASGHEWRQASAADAKMHMRRWTWLMQDDLAPGQVNVSLCEGGEWWELGSWDGRWGYWLSKWLFVASYSNCENCEVSVVTIGDEQWGHAYPNAILCA